MADVFGTFVTAGGARHAINMGNTDNVGEVTESVETVVKIIRDGGEVHGPCANGEWVIIPTSRIDYISMPHDVLVADGVALAEQED